MPQPIALSAQLPDDVHPAVRLFARDVQALIDKPLYRATASADAEGTHGANVRRVTLQVRNRRREALKDRFLVEWWIAAMPGAAPSNTGNTVAVVTGTTFETLLPNAHYRTLTDANGVVQFDLTIAGAASRVVGTLMGAGVEESAAFAWT